MLIPCPHCGPRDLNEFTYSNDATVMRPAADADITAWDEFVHIRDNPKGIRHEHWQHVSGCRRWITVTRDVVTHRIIETAAARTVTP